MNIIRCSSCKYIKNIKTVITGLKCNNENSNMYGEYVDESCCCDKWQLRSKLRNKTLKNNILDSISYYEERLEEEIGFKSSLENEYSLNISKCEGRIEILGDIIDDLQHDILNSEEEDK